MLRALAQRESDTQEFYRDVKKAWNKMSHKQKGELTKQHKESLKHD